ncbi:MAG TPA: HEAT repeat domain-containing protein [Tepidisphaeraceae bacterium]|nr:HEAT repeat domain-containing protein [Tepidisphaeraceae bacterium]
MQDLQQQAAALRSPSSSIARREEAAHRLLSRPSPQAFDVLRGALQTTDNPTAQIAVARALGDDPNANPVFIPLLIGAIGPNRALSEAAAEALANYPGNNQAAGALQNVAENARLPETTRTNIVRAMGGMIDKATADYLVNLMNSRTGPMQAAAIEALARMSGNPTASDDPQRLQQWWNVNANKSEEAFRADLLAARAAEANRLRLRHAQLTDDLRTLLADQYRMLSDPRDVETRKVETLFNLLNSRDPAVRAVGPEIVLQDFQNNRPIDPAIRARLRAMVGDSDSNVRREVVNTITEINDRDAAKAFITQLRQESVPDIRTKLARALGRMGDPQAVTLLLEMLQSQNTAEATLAANALGEMGDKLRQTNPGAAQQVGDALRKIIDATATSRDATGLRAACVAALGALHDPRAVDTFLPLLRPNVDSTIRKAALHGLASLGDPNTAEPIALLPLIDPDASIRLEAARALQNIATFAQSEQLYRMLDPREEPNAQVRDAVWDDLNRVLHSGTTQQLNGWPDRFKNDPPKRLETLYALRDSLIKDGNQEQLAFTRQNIAAELMNLDPKQTDEAADNIQKALDYWRGEGHSKIGSETTLDGLVGQMLSVLFEAKKYDDAAAFAAKQIEINRQYQETVGSRIKQEADRLHAAGRNSDATALIDAALRMSPPLDSKYQRDLRDIRAEAVKPSPVPGP